MSILPTAADAVKKQIQDFVILMYGPPKIGKTEFCSQIKDALFLSTEPGTVALGCSTVEIGSYSDWKMTIEALSGGEPHKFKAIVIDTVDLLFPMYCRQLATELGVSDVGDNSLYGMGWRELKDRWAVDLSSLRTIRNDDGEKLLIVFISHERTSPIVERRGSKEVDTGRTYTTSDLPPAGRKILHSAVDFILRAEFNEDGERVIRTQPGTTPTGEIFAGCRGRRDRPIRSGFPLEWTEFLTAFDEVFSTEQKPTVTPPPRPAKKRSTKR